MTDVETTLRLRRDAARLEGLRKLAIRWREVKNEYNLIMDSRVGKESRERSLLWVQAETRIRTRLVALEHDIMDAVAELAEED